MALKEGMEVEVRCNEEGYRGAWVEGIVRSIKRGVFKINLKKPTSGNEKSLVKVKKFIRDNGKSSVKVSLGDVRPIPPHSKLPLHCLDGVAVEARETDCWWPGFIVRQVSCDGHQLWLVYFRHTKILTAYPLSCLRPAQEWQGGIWTSVPPEKNLNIGQVIRVLSAEETLKSSNQCEVSQGCSSNQKIQPVNTTESSFENQHCEEPALSSGLQASFEPLKRTCLEEQKEHCNEAQNAKEMKVDVPEAKEGVIEIEDEREVLEDAYRARPGRIGKKFHRRRHRFSMREF